MEVCFFIIIFAVTKTNNSMTNKICCPNCKSENVRSVDNEPLYHPSQLEVEKGIPRLDEWLYVKFVCDNCEHNFTKTFKLNLETT